MLDELKERVTSMLSRVELGPEAPLERALPPRPQGPMWENHPEAALGYAGDVDVLEAPSRLSLAGARAEAINPEDPATWQGVARNAPCPCGSGKKFKHCHGRAG